MTYQLNSRASGRPTGRFLWHRQSTVGRQRTLRSGCLIDVIHASSQPWRTRQTPYTSRYIGRNCVIPPNDLLKYRYVVVCGEFLVV